MDKGGGPGTGKLYTDPHQWVRGQWPWGYGSALSTINQTACAHWEHTERALPWAKPLFWVSGQHRKQHSYASGFKIILLCQTVNYTCLNWTCEGCAWEGSFATCPEPYCTTLPAWILIAASINRPQKSIPTT